MIGRADGSASGTVTDIRSSGCETGRLDRVGYRKSGDSTGPAEEPRNVPARVSLKTTRAVLKHDVADGQWK